ncbi:MAG: hypothetical protein ACFFCI_20435 [Promethearchaeota archaeon]
MIHFNCNPTLWEIMEDILEIRDPIIFLTIVFFEVPPNGWEGDFFCNVELSAITRK